MGEDGLAFDRMRPRLIRIAYRMLGSLAEAEDVVQDAYVRWHKTDRVAVANAEAFLTRTVTRLCLDQLKSARARRETYIGPWLPEPIFEAEPEAGDADDLTLTLMMALERLSPLERAAFLLHDVFGQDFDTVAEAIGREPAACRQLAARARDHVRAARPRFPVSRDRGLEIADAFMAATRSGDVTALRSLLAADVVAQADGGGKRPAAPAPIIGGQAVAQFFADLSKRPGYLPPQILARGLIDGLPGIVSLQNGVLQTTAFAIEDGRIVAIYVTRNPDKLQRIGAMVGASGE
ncbi:sigma-70 family RNA polymerase sigma factor [Phreatobacter stygius]|uniref:Sigma-70 family RNA polymerase sigma factor n=2 Tax=Phreatobacter stygius TaxID=1940610 RepID=A0A4D7BI98_9HYPH|nr:sigma-70 family RNA polymerase sigma factor [Phreatobacter stygius]